MISKKHSFGLLSKNETKGLTQTEEVVDDKKRLFLKTLGIVGAGALVFSLLPKKVRAVSFGGVSTASKVKLKNSGGAQVDPATNTTLATVKTNFDSLHTKDADIITNTANVIANTANLPTLTHYGSMAGSLPVVISDGQPTIPVSGTGRFTPAKLSAVDNNSLWYLRKVMKRLEPLNTVGTGQRQRLAVDGCTDMTFVNTGSATASVAGIGLPMYRDIARNAFANGIRKKLLFN